MYLLSVITHAFNAFISFILTIVHFFMNNFSLSKQNTESEQKGSREGNNEIALTSYGKEIKDYYRDKINKINQDFNKAKKKIEEMETNKLNQLHQRLNQLKKEEREKYGKDVIDITYVNQNTNSMNNTILSEDKMIQGLNDRLNNILNKKGNK